MEAYEQRKLDVAKPASTDILSLNNKIIMMRPAVKKAKGQTVQKIIRRVKSLRNKKGTEEEKNKDKRKIERQLEVMYAIKDLKLDKVSKFAIGYDSVLQEITEKSLGLNFFDKFKSLHGLYETWTEANLQDQELAFKEKPDASAEMKALARLSEHTAMKDEVDKFRKDHDDWKSLSEFLLNHIPRRFYKNKYKESKSKMATNVNAGNVLVKTYLESKIGKDSELTVEDNSGVSVNASDIKLVKKSTEIEKVSPGQTTHVKDESPQELTKVMPEISCILTNVNEETKKSTEIEKVSPQKTSKVRDKSPKKFTKIFEEKHKLTNVNEESDTSEVTSKQANEEEDSNSNGDNDSLIESENIEISDGQDNAESESREEDSDNAENESREEGSDNAESEISEEDSDDDEQVESENEDHTKIKGEMVVKKLNMDDLVNSKDEDIPDFLVANSKEENISKVRKSKDSFFERRDSDNSDDEVSDRNLSSTHSDSESDDNDMGEDEKREASRNAISSSFLGALNEVKLKHRPFDGSDGRGFGGGWGHFDRRNDSRGRGGFDRRNDSRGRGGFDRRNDSRGRGGFDRRNNSRGMGYFDRQDDSRGRGQYRGFGNSDRFDNYRGRGGQEHFERQGRGNFRGKFSNVHQNAPRDFQRSDHRGSSYRQNQLNINRNVNSHADNKGSSTKTEEKIHPSWEASKKRKEHSTIQAFQGKKIKFDD